MDNKVRQTKVSHHTVVRLQDKSTALIVAARRGDRKTVERLVESGANILAEDNVSSFDDFYPPLCPFTTCIDRKEHNADLVVRYLTIYSAHYPMLKKSISP